MLLMLASNFLFPLVLRTAGERIVINEIAAYESSGNEWVEIYNAGVDPVDLTGWKFWEGNANHGLTVTRGTFVLGGGEYAIIAQDGEVFVINYPDVGVTILDSSWGSLNESGEEVGLKDGAGAFIEQFTYIEAKDFSLERIDPLENVYTTANWREHAGSHTAGKANVSVPTPVEDDGGEPPEDDPVPITLVPLIINEFVSDPVEGEKEWVEIYNPTESALDLAGWKLEDVTGSSIASPTSTILSHGFIVVYLSSAKLNNSGDTVRLKNVTAQVVDEIIYGAGQAPMAGKGQSVARAVDGGDSNMITDFALTVTPTPGAANVITTTVIEAPNISPPAPQASSGNSTGGSSARFFSPHEVVINELVSDPGDGMDEFVELFNTTNNLIALDGWHLEDGSETETVLSGNIQPGKFFLIERPKGSLNNAGDTVVLFDPSGKEIDSVTYGTWDDGNLSDNAAVPNDPTSLARKTDGQDSDNDYYDFVLTMTITSGKANVISMPQQTVNTSPINAPLVSGSIVISEIHPNPKGSDSDDEFIEFKNIGKETVDLKNWKLSDSGTKKYTITQGTVAPGNFIIFKRTMTGIALNNTGGDDVKLFMPTGVLADQAHYSGVALEEQSYARSLEGTWSWTTKLTPEKENIFEGGGSAPVIALDVETEVAVGEPVIFDASDSTSESGKLTFEWEFGDGDKGEGSMVTHAYLRQGKFTAMVKASALSSSSTKKVVITVKDPLAFVGGPAGDVSGILISEIFPNPAGVDDNEFIELFNPTELAIDLSSMKLDDEDGGSKPYTIPDGTIISTGEYLVFKREETKLALNNTNDAARLLSSEEDVIVEIEFEGVKEAAAYAWDGKTWAWSAVATPGESNRIAAVLGAKKTMASSAKAKKVKAIIETTVGTVREQDIGDAVKVVGVVAVLPGVLGTQYFYIMSESGSVGVQVYMYTKDFPVLAVGDVVEIIGDVAESAGETRIKVASKEAVVKVRSGSLAEPAVITSEDVGEPYEGSIISIAGEVTEVKKTYLYLDDGLGEIKVYFKKGAEIDSKNVRPGDLVTVTGIVNQTKAGYQLLPRSANDIAKTGVSPDVVVEVKTEENQTAAVAETYLSTTAGGLTAIFLGLVAKTRGAVAVEFGKKAMVFALAAMKRFRG